MPGLRQAVATIAAALSLTTLSVSAQANFFRCGYDRYGYHPPDFIGCYWLQREGWGNYPAYGYYPPFGSYASPRYEGNAIGPISPVVHGCYYNNGYDLKVHLICY
jgi:hypothetical protein